MEEIVVKRESLIKAFEKWNALYLEEYENENDGIERDSEKQSDFLMELLEEEN